MQNHGQRGRTQGEGARPQQQLRLHIEPFAVRHRLYYSPTGFSVRRCPPSNHQLITVNQVIKPLNALPRRLHVIDWKIIETNQDFLPVLALSFRENQTDIGELHQGS